MIDDDLDLGETITPMLELYGITLTQAATPQDGLARLRQDRPDVLLLDMMLPGTDGMDVCRQIRAAPDLFGTPPIVVLSARAELTDRVVGLEAGVDDYIAKPFELRELVARLRAITRARQRPALFSAAPGTASLPQDGLVLDRTRLEATFNGVRVAVTDLELHLLGALQAARGEVLSRTALLSHLGHSPDSDPALVDTLVYRIRQRFRADGGATDVIITVRGQGYRVPEGGRP